MKTKARAMIIMSHLSLLHTGLLLNCHAPPTQLVLSLAEDLIGMSRAGSAEMRLCCV